jgi:hypothetical protein
MQTSSVFTTRTVAFVSSSNLDVTYTTLTRLNHTVLAVTMVEANKSKYTNRDYSRALLARKIQVLVGRPELKDFLRYIDSHSLPNCPIHRQDAINAHAILGRDVGSLKGKITRQQL